MNTVLKYIGNGAHFPGVPAADMTQADIDASGMTLDALVKSGLYARVEVKAEKAATKKGAQGE